MGADYDITTVGMVNVNLAVSPVGADLFRRDVSLINPVALSPGGDAMNEALTAARLSNSVAVVGKIGNDLFGRYVLEKVREAGIDGRYLQVDEKSTAVGLMMIGEDGNRNICAYRGAYESLCLEDVDFYPIRHSRYVNIGSMLALKNLDGEGVREILKQAKEAGAVTSADTKQDTYGIGFSGIQSCFDYLDYFLPSYEEAYELSKQTDPAKQARFFLRYGCRGVVIKLGEKGCYLAGEKAEETYLPAYPSQPVDTSGAGDNFVAGFLTGLKNGLDMKEAARFGSAAAAISIRQFGSNGAVTSFEQVEKYYKAFKE